MKINRLTWIIVLFVSPITSMAQTVTNTSDEHFTIENYYKVRWGTVDEFVSLYKKNHFPLLKKAFDKGDVVKIEATKPILHSSEESRWDFKVTITFKNVQAAFDPKLLDPYKKQLYPDSTKLAKDEQHRFELLIAHWDVAVSRVDLNK